MTVVKTNCRIVLNNKISIHIKSDVHSALLLIKEISLIASKFILRRGKYVNIRIQSTSRLV